MNYDLIEKKVIELQLKISNKKEIDSVYGVLYGIKKRKEWHEQIISYLKMARKYHGKEGELMLIEELRKIGWKRQTNWNND